MTVELHDDATSPAVGVQPPVTEGRRRLTATQWWGIALFAGLVAGYLAVGAYLYLAVGYINPDASSRVGNAGFTIWSRDPHLGAIGFVWNPLPSLIEIPLVELSSHWPLNQWPELRRVGFAGAVMSALFMAGAGWQVRRIALDYGAGRLLRWIAVAAFALNPMIILYAGMGMSEAPFLFFLLWTCRRILLWVNRSRVLDLVIAGVALGLAYLTRYEALPAAAGVAVGVFVVSTRRHRPEGVSGRAGWRAGAGFGVHDATIVAMPTAFAFVVWAGLGWLLDGNAFSQFSSQYGNSAQVEAAGIVSAEDVGAGPLAEVIVANLLGMQPLLFAVLPVVAWIAVRLRRVDAAVPAVVFGSVLLFQMSAVILGSTFGWFRFYLASTPLIVVAVLVACGPARPLLPEVRGAKAAGPSERSESRSTSDEGSGDPHAAPTRRSLSSDRSLRSLDPRRSLSSDRSLRRSDTRRSLSSDRSLRRSCVERTTLTTLMALVLATSLPVTASSMLNPALGKEEYGLRSAFWPDRHPPSEFWFYWFGEVSGNVAAWLDSQNLPEGSVLVDTFGVSRVWLESERPAQFVVRSDFDFFAKLNAPAEQGVQYILTQRPTGLGSLDAINVRYPTLWADGADIATVAMTVTTPTGKPQFRIYRIKGSTPAD
ncbi:MULTISPECIES: glycosyltransferase family 39 protein [unclassified Gordonia (in: high G+C Gram-positive bacteria)]|uniref:ArnT family glycosyltransferase n=1 Tax=unclassified Gordonia (in: high G+C Gram-positive bacteria) TaxID=2657482 RepID=UPI001965BD7F|nr:MULTISPECIES: glycosyltransferase family 39 protein [unclassified Gordonia (in: high G+C Gram-positive bacteria)]MBN0974518.1 glycosyltransferase family 39 protein [Gordonia sp. BP-119]MBN0984466.1 glycosyltransferase family 39 protein [Gordonia sp. BP-94]